MRELENLIERAVILEETDTIKVESLPLGLGGGRVAAKATGPTLPDTLSIKKAEEALEKELISRALEKTGGNKTKAAELLEISHRTLLYKIKNYEL